MNHSTKKVVKRDARSNDEATPRGIQCRDRHGKGHLADGESQQGKIAGLLQLLRAGRNGEFLLDVLDVHEKCRIVIEYDPAEERAAVYRTEFEGKPITFNEYRPDQNEKSDGNHVEQ